MTDLSDLIFRRHPAYELVEYSQLPGDVRETLRPLATAPDFYGVLQPVTAGPTIQAVDQATALLWYHFEAPRALPDYLRRHSSSDQLSSSVAGLLDAGILQCWDGESWDSRPAAASTATSTDVLSATALQHAAMLRRIGESDPLRLSSQLYGFHHEPLGVDRRRALRTPHAILAAVGLDWVPRQWTRTTPTPTDPWIRWSPASPGRATCKVYVTPTLSDAPQVLPAAARLAVELETRGYKLGGTARDLTRPDRFLVYVRDRDQATEFAARAVALLGERQGRGVPFTASLDGQRHLFSLGVDPLDTTVAWLGGSWRRRVTDALAAGMARLAASASVSELVAAATAQAQRSGVDPRTWEPVA